MVVAVVTVRVMEVALYQVVDMVTVRHGLVAATRAVLMAGFVPAAVMGRRAADRVYAVHLEAVFVDMVLVRVMEVPFVQVIDMPIVDDRGVTAAGTVYVVVWPFVLLMAHGSLPFLSAACSSAARTSAATWSSTSS